MRTDRWSARSFLVGIALTVVAPAPAFAQQSSSSPGPSETESILRRAIGLRASGHDDEALAEFRRAYALTRSPLTTGQLGLAEQAVGEWIPAELHVRTALDAHDDAWVSRNRAALEQAYSVIAQHVGAVDIRGGPVGARVRIDGEFIGTLPLEGPIHVRAGNVLVEVSADGFYSVSRRVLVSAGVLARESVDLRAVEQAVVAQSDSQSAPPRIAVVAETAPSRAAPVATSMRAPLSPTVLALGAVGAVSLAASVVTLSVRESVAVDYDAGGCSAQTQLSQTCQTLFDTHAAMVATGVVTGVLGVGLATASVVSYLLGRTPRARPQAFECSSSIVGLSLVCTMRF